VALLEALEDQRREVTFGHLRGAHHGLLRVARRSLLRVQLLREALDIGCLEPPDALGVNHRVEPRALESAHGGDADAETLGDIIAREPGKDHVVIALLRG
jgi:hypothetical protein